ncbi:restriction endonuclease subunit S [Phaeodactylibacter xiamenensis]|uniref:restriction endonuclease subunit S n=1 Tax=Phaeodactylibacter xiamenensis TaxID=1524460 RepID=UPI003BACBF63
MNIERTIPESWESVNIEEVTIPPLKTNKKKEDPSGQFLYVDINSINNQIQRIEEPKSYTWMDAPSRAQQILKTGDTVFSTVRPYLKNIAIVDERLNNQIASTGFCVVRPIQIHPKYIYYFLTTNSFIQKVNRLAKGTSYPAVTNQVIYDQELPLPPLNEQHRIVAKIEELFSELDNGIANLQLAQQQLKVYRQSLLKAAFEGKLTEEWRKQHNPEPAEKLLERIKAERQARYEREVEEWKAAVKEWEEGGKEGKKPLKPRKLKPHLSLNKDELALCSEITTDWLLQKVGNICEVKGGKRLPKGAKYADGKTAHPYLRVTDFGNFTIDKQDLKFISESTHKKIERYTIQKDDTYISIAGTIGVTGVIQDDLDGANLTENAAKLTNQVFLNNRYMAYFLGSQFAQNQIRLKTKATSQPKLALYRIEEIVIPVPTLNEQAEIVNEIEAQLSRIENASSSIEKDLKKAELTKQSVLKKAFEGKLVAQDPRDEPASVLLERIKEQKAKYLSEQKKLKKTRKKKEHKMAKKLSVEEVLKAAKKPMEAKLVWKESEHQDDIEKFYAALKALGDKLIETKTEDGAELSLKQ